MRKGRYCGILDCRSITLHRKSLKVKLWKEIADLLGAPKGNVLILLSPKYCYRVISSVKFKCLFWPVINCTLHNSTSLDASSTASSILFLIYVAAGLTPCACRLRPAMSLYLCLLIAILQRFVHPLLHTILRHNSNTELLKI